MERVASSEELEEAEPTAPSRSRAQLQRTAELMQLEARLMVLTHFLGGILFELDRAGRYLEVWAGEPDLLVRPADELLGRTVTEIIGPEQADRFIETFGRVIESGVPESFEYILEVPAGRRSFRCEVRRTPPVAGAVGPATVTLLVRDITAETELKAKLVQAERLAAMGLVAASIGHEIRQPLAFATTSLEVLSRELEAVGTSSQRSREALAHVQDALRRISGVAASVGVVAPDPHRARPTDVKRPTMAAIDLCASELLGRARVDVDVDVAARVALNEGELCQVLTNLLLNAAHAVDPAKAATNRIEVRAIVEGATVCTSVTDNGCGIEPALVHRIFDPFFTTKEPGRGTGLGLFASRRLVEKAGGALEVESCPGKGTTVRVILPIAPDADEPVRPAPPVPIGRPTLLVIDDEPSFLRSLKLVLSDSHEVIVCPRAEEALALLRDAPARFDVVLCDLSMPQVDGVTFYDQMAALGIGDRFVLMTAGAFTPRTEAFVGRTQCPRLAKPFAVEELLDVIARVSAR